MNTDAKSLFDALVILTRWQIKLNEKRFFRGRIGNEKRTLKRKLRKKLRNYEESVAKKQMEQDN